MIGRVEEKEILLECLNSPRPEFLAVYGRRRVGKTYLIREYFNNQFSFYATGILNQNKRSQLRAFHAFLQENGDESSIIPKDWFEAFLRLKKILLKDSVYREPFSGKKVVFLDEIPWMDAGKSDFKSALDFFWNSWGSSQNDLLLIICGSATSWMMTNIINDTGGLYKRITMQMKLLPFTLKECELLLSSNGVDFNRRQIIECYMIFGGIPFYLNFLRPNLSLAQNVERLCFLENSPLRNEFEILFQSLFKNATNYINVIKTLAKKGSGMTRTEILESPNSPQGKDLTKCLTSLEQCGFIRKYNNFTKQNTGAFYQVIDPFTIFHLTFLETNKVVSWLDFFDSPAYYNWCGIAFERVCMLHINQIKMSLGIQGITSQVFSWRSKSSSPGAQIDLIIDRRDQTINLCEIKYTEQEFVITAAYEKNLLNKKEVFRRETKTDKTLSFVMIAPFGIQRNSHSYSISNIISSDDLFR